MTRTRGTTGFVLAGLLATITACSSSDKASETGDGGRQESGGSAGSGGGASGSGNGQGAGGLSSTGGSGSSGRSASGGSGNSNGGKGGGTGGRASKGGTSNGSGGVSTGGASNGGAGNGGASSGGAGGAPPGSATAWLYTKGNKIYVTGDDVNPWVGRGVNIDDIFFCGFNYNLGMPNPGDTFKQMVSGLMSAWKPTFLRVSLSMNSFPTGATASWLTNPAQYKNPMVDAIKSFGANPKTYVLVTLRTDKSMIVGDSGNPEATAMPSDATNSPDKTAYPTGTDAVYKALVNDFKDSPFVLFGLTNEPGGNQQTDVTIAAAMTHAVSAIRDEEDRIGSHHHVIAVQGRAYTSDIKYYASKPIASDNVVYEVHGYPPSTDSYTYANLPVIIGEYGSLDGNGDSFYNDVESKKIPNLAWDFQPFSGCAPDLVDVTHDATKLVPNDWGKVVQAYLLAHAK